jgi:hypothetical protein
MALRIVEFFGYSPLDSSPSAKKSRRECLCPFLDNKCTKLLHDGSAGGACTVRQSAGDAVICCPNRFYDENYQVLQDVATLAFGGPCQLISGDDVSRKKHNGHFVVAFGKRWGKELRLPKRRGTGGYFVDWILALIGRDGELSEFIAVEVQAIDTTGNYRDERASYLAGREFKEWSSAGLNWENVSKRILPQLIYKGHVLRQERLCRKGLFFICPSPVFSRVEQRLGSGLRPYQLQPGSLTFVCYDPGPTLEVGRKRVLIAGQRFTTTTDQVALAFTAPTDMPPAGVYQTAIETELASFRS